MGEVLTALSKKILQPPSVVLLETMAPRRAVHFVHEISIPSSILKGDSKTSTNALRNGDCSNSSFGHLIKDIIFLFVLCITIPSRIPLGKAMLWLIL